ncbi:serine-rich adhesin for platelets isoform X2 [Polyergus mexicanus]|uniref:serine-rich adhesin for platelets isoform X2 n=1 Tax=Polyergus mexicanus TaxID=615972 RepID=UPI0038B5899C
MYVVKIVYCQVTMEFVDQDIGGSREGNRYDSHSAQSTQERSKLLKRTRSLAVISEDDSRQNREVTEHFRLGQSSFDLPRKYQLIPRAKLIDRNSLKDRLSKSQQHLSDSFERFSETKPYHSRSTCGLHSIPPGLASLPDPLPYVRGNRENPNRLNILDWPDPPRRYRSVQNLDTVSGLIDIVEDTWPIEGNRSIDCIYTQVKRKRKEHRSLDSIAFEDDAELEYFDVLNLLPLPNIRLGYDEAVLSKDDNFTRETKQVHGSRHLRVLEHNETSSTSEVSPTRSSNATDEEKCKEHTDNPVSSNSSEKKVRDLNLSKGTDSRRRDSVKRERRKSDESLEKDSQISLANKLADQRVLFSSSKTDQNHRKADVEDLVTSCEEDRKVEEVEDYKSIWISDNEEHHEMSRRPQVLKVVDNDVTKRRHRRSVVEIDAIVEDMPKDKISQSITKETNERLDVSVIKSSNNANKEDEVDGKNAKDATLPELPENMVEDVRNFFERKTTKKETTRNKQNEGRFERIVKETSNILGKACSVVKGSLGFEARSESSDLGLGSESGSDSRRRSMDDGAEDDRLSRNVDNSAAPKIDDDKKSHTNLTRSRSCVDSIECQEDGPEFDHVRYKIVKSHMFSKNMFNTARDDVTYEGLMQYLREYSFQELLMDNNVVIIEPVRAEPVERKSSPLTRTEPTCKIAGAIQKKMENCERNDEQFENGGTGKTSRQSSIRKHFFYHPIRVNRELIDEELPDPDTVKNVRRMFENTLEKKKNAPDAEFSEDCKNRRSVSMKDLTSIDDSRYDEMSDKAREESRCSSRAKDLTRLFETKSASSTASVINKEEEPGSPRSESKTRILAQSFEARSRNSSPSGSNCSKNKVGRYHHHHQNWDTGSVSSGVSSDYPDTDPGSGAHCTLSDDDDVNCNDDDADESGPGHYVSQDILKKIRECGTSVTYYGGKVVNMHNGPFISPLIGNGFKRIDKSNDYVKFKLVKSNSCDSRLELTGRLIEELRRNCDRDANLRQCTIAETPSIEITTIDSRQENEKRRDEGIEQIEQMKREPPVVIGLEPKKEDSKETRRTFKADFKLGDLDDLRSNYPSKFMPSALTRWEANTSWRVGNDFGKMEFEEFEVLEDSLNGIDDQDQYVQES